MKKIIFFFLILFLFIINTSALDNNIINYSNTLTIPSNNKINDITGTNTYYLLITENNNTTISKYDYQNQLLTSKEFPELYNSKIIKVDNNYFLVGNYHNTLKIYYLDESLRIINQNDSSIIISKNATINLYYYNHKIYILLTNNDLLYDNLIYEVDSSLNIISNNFSSYDSTILKEILNSTYYLLHNNEQKINNDLIHYYDSTYTNKDTILIGTKIEENGFQKAFLTIINKENKNLTYEEYNKFLNIKLVNDKYLVLATKDDSSYLLTLDYEGNIITKEKLTAAYNKIYKVNNKIILLNPILSDIVFYNYQLNINYHKSEFSTINIPSKATANNQILLDIKTNSGYEVESINITDEQGNDIAIINNSFTMPENNVYININYQATITNPETLDLITITLIIFIVISIILIISKRKLNWLK